MILLAHLLTAMMITGLFLLTRLAFKDDRYHSHNSKRNNDGAEKVWRPSRYLPVSNGCNVTVRKKPAPDSYGYTRYHRSHRKQALLEQTGAAVATAVAILIIYCSLKKG